jgi:hypothetical protein
MAIFVLSPLVSFYLLRVQDLVDAVAEIARMGLLLFLLYPGLSLLISWLRGLMINIGVTSVVNAGMVLNLFVTAVILGIGVAADWPGINSAAVALSVAATLELLYLWSRIRNIFDFSFLKLGESRAVITS